MTVLTKLASFLDKRGDVPNKELAARIAAQSDRKSISELVQNLSNESKAIQHDCIKVLYEIGERKPALIAEFASQFVELLDNKNNRLQWGAMTALDTITLDNPKVVYSALKKIVKAANAGSVITRDHAVKILTKLGSIKHYSIEVFPLLFQQLAKSPVNQLPMYAENALPIISEKTKERFVEILVQRLGDIEQESKRKRLDKVIRKVNLVGSM